MALRELRRFRKVRSKLQELEGGKKRRANKKGMRLWDTALNAGGGRSGGGT